MSIVGVRLSWLGTFSLAITDFRYREHSHRCSLGALGSSQISALRACHSQIYLNLARLSTSFLLVPSLVVRCCLLHFSLLPSLSNLSMLSIDGITSNLKAQCSLLARSSAQVSYTWPLTAALFISLAFQGMLCLLRRQSQHIR